MREQRWESRQSLSFPQVLDLLKRLQAKGLRPVDPEKEGICYVEEWPVPSPEAIQRLEQWPLEDVTMMHVLDDWKDDFFLLAGRYHSTFQRYQSVNAYCSISHPWHLSGHLATLQPLAMFWVGFRHTHSFIRVRFHTATIIAQGEPYAPHQQPIWLEERQAAFREAIELLDLPMTSRSRRTGSSFAPSTKRCRFSVPGRMRSARANSNSIPRIHLTFSYRPAG